MRKKKEILELNPESGMTLIEKNGKTFRLKEEKFNRKGHQTAIIFEEFDKDEWDRRINNLAETLINDSGLTAKTILVDILKSTELKTLKQAEREVQKGEKAKIKDGCINLQIGKVNIQISG